MIENRINVNCIYENGIQYNRAYQGGKVVYQRVKGYEPPQPTIEYRWVEMTGVSDFICDGYDKYAKEKKQQSSDGGITWEDVVPSEYRKGRLIESDSEDCGYVPPQPTIEYRWVEMTGVSDFICDGYDKYAKEKKQQSSDGGITWEDVVPSEYRKGRLIESDSEDCGYVPPTPINGKLTYTISGITNEIQCNTSNTLSNLEIFQDASHKGLKTSAMTVAIIGDCVKTVGQNAFIDLYALTSVTISTNVETIGSSAFKDCTSLSSITIPNKVTEISMFLFEGDYELSSVDIPTGTTTIGKNAFFDCLSLLDITIPASTTSIEDEAFRVNEWTSRDPYQYNKMNILKTNRVVRCLATTPPTIGYGVFGIDDMCASDIATYKIYVPSESLEAYKNAWTCYAHRIFPLL